MMQRQIHLGLELADNHRVSQAGRALSAKNQQHHRISSSSRGGNLFSSIFKLSKKWLHGLAGALHVAVRISDEYETPQGQRRRDVLVEIERAVGLPRAGRRTAPFIVVLLNGTEVGRTPPVKVMERQAYTWVDKIFELPVCDGCHGISFEMWNMKSSGSGGNGDDKVGEFLGEARISVESIIQQAKGSGDDEMLELSLDFKLWNDDRGPGEGEAVSDVESKSGRCTCPSAPPSKGPQHAAHCEPESTIHPRENTATEYAAHAQGNKRRRRRHPLRRPPEVKATTQSHYRIPNPDPFRRRDVRGAFDDGVGGGSCLSSTFCRALGLIGLYLLLGVAGFSFCFEQLSVRDGLYLSVVTFSTLGYGDVPITTKGGKLFSCAFALTGIGIIGIALGYIGQQLVQAQMLALQMASRKKAAAAVAAAESSLKETCSDPMTPDSLKKGLGQRQGPDLQQSNSAGRQLVLSIVPIVVLILIGSLVVGRYEGWDAVDSIYWCVITGTSVGFGDKVPQTGSMRWFCIVYIPLAVGAYSTALGRIANIFVEREIRKNNAKLLQREVTLEDLETMNDDGDGEVSPLEFVEHMLKSMNKVDQALLDDLHRQFDVLDADGSGGLQEDDIVILTERKLTERRQKVLVKYRDALLRRRGSVFGRVSAQIHPDPANDDIVEVSYVAS